MDKVKNKLFEYKLKIDNEYPDKSGFEKSIILMRLLNENNERECLNLFTEKAINSLSK